MANLIEYEKNNFVKLGYTDKSCQHPTGAGKQCANDIDYL